MNLMDILSRDGQDSGRRAIVPIQAYNIQQVYYLPTVLSRIQKEIMDMILHIFSSELLKEVQTKVLRTSINSLLDNDVPVVDSIATYDMVSLLFDELRVVAKHPSLMVDHFIPKKLLLLQTNEKLVNLSGNFQLFNRLIDTIVETFTTSQYNVLVVAQSIKDLELIEGVIIGKDLYYNNLGGSKLYESNRQQTTEKVCLNLVTSHQLYNNITPHSNHNLIFSFDLELDVTTPSLVRTDALIVIPMPVFSLEHIIRLIPAPSRTFYNTRNVSNPLYKWKLRVIHALLVNRENIWESDEFDESKFFLSLYGRKMNSLEVWLKYGKSDVSQYLTSFDRRIQLDFQKDALIAKIKKTHLSLDDHKLGEINYKNYRLLLTKYFNSRLDELEASVSEVYKEVIPRKRLAETQRQLLYDQEEEEIATNYHKLRKINDEALNVEKELIKTGNELTKLTTKKDDLSAKVEYLADTASIDVSEQEVLLSKLKKELENFTLEYSNLDSENEIVRLQYQTKSSEAVQLTNTMDKIKAQSLKEQRKLQGPGMRSLPSFIRKDVLTDIELNLAVLRNNNQFLSLFLRERLETLTKERHTIIEATSSGSNSRPTNRISRAATPL